jgi:hypothetical protein
MYARDTVGLIVLPFGPSSTYSMLNPVAVLGARGVGLAQVAYLDDVARHRRTVCATLRAYRHYSVFTFGLCHLLALFCRRISLTL